MYPLVSVVVPAYNAEPFIDDCLFSILNQRIKSMEVIVVDDGSTDATAERVKRFAESDSRITLVTQPNGGVSKARNRGIDLAKGDFVTFVDADDFLHPDALSRMMGILESTGAGVSICRLKSVKVNASARKVYEKYEGKAREDTSADYEVFDYLGAMEMALYQKFLMNSPCGALMRRELLGGKLRFREGTRYEDLDAFYRFYEEAGKIVYTDSPLYYYRNNPDSFTNRWSESRLDVLDVTDRLADFFDTRYPAMSAAAADRRFSAHFNILILMLRHGVDDTASIKRCLAVIRNGRRQALKDRKVRLKNKTGALLSYGGLPLLRLLAKL